MNQASAQLSQERREQQPPPMLTLLELDPRTVIDGVRVEQGFEAQDAKTFGAMREFCPACQDVNLQLVLRQERVKIAHLFCPQCTRCYTASYPDGSCALSLV